MIAEPDWTHHCADEAGAAVRAAGGPDVWAILGAPPPRSWREAAELYRRHGVRSLGEIVTRALGEPIPALQAQRGDIVLKGWALGVARGDLAEFCGGTVPIGEVDQAWPSVRR